MLVGPLHIFLNYRNETAAVSLWVFEVRYGNGHRIACWASDEFHLFGLILNFYILTADIILTTVPLEAWLWQGSLQTCPETVRDILGSQHPL